VYEIVCINCSRHLAAQALSYNCPNCGGLLDFARPLLFDESSIDRDRPGIWSYKETFGIPQAVEPVSLGEGNTPLVKDEIEGKKVAFKLEYLNPTGSFKDRGTSVLISFMSWLGIKTAVEDSSGNAGASFAAYAARSGIRGRVFIPESASGPKRTQIEAYGIDLELIPGPRSNAAEAVKRESELGTFYASHVYHPHVLAGCATVAYEIVAQLGESPGTVIAPVGQGSLLLGMARGFEAMFDAELISQLPRLIGVQARVCAPLWTIATYGEAALESVYEGQTIAEGIRIRYPVRGDQVLNAVKESQGFFTVVDEDEIIPARDQLALRGLYVEPTSAVVFPALLESIDELPETIVVVLTGSGFKFNQDLY
jgi:threonine synthase